MKINQKGLTLIEMMIAIVIGLIMTSAVMTIFVSNTRSNSDSVAMIRLNQELRGTMTFISDELKRSGYNSGAYDSYMEELDINDAGGDDISDDNCITYAYQEPGSSAVSTVPATSIYGFRLVGTVDEIKWGASADLGCSFGIAITEANIAEITEFEIKLVETKAGAVEVNQVEVTITGETVLSGGTIASRTISEIIRVRNDAL